MVASMKSTDGPALAAYDKTAVIFHWASALAILLLWPIGKIMANTGETPNSVLFPLHVIIGLGVAVATLARVIWVLRHQRPEKLEMPRSEKILFVANHYVLYSLLLLLSLSGIVMLISAGSLDAFALAKNNGPRDQHELASTVFAVMFVMHVAGVTYYQVKHGKTLKRMGVPVSR
jgi:cytochrome b561